MENEYVLINQTKPLNANVFGERVKEVRIYHNLTQAEMAEMMGLTAASIISYEKNQKRPSIEVAAKMAHAFNVSLDWLCGLTDITQRLVPVTYADALKKIISTVMKDVNIGFTRWEVNNRRFNCFTFLDQRIDGFIDEYRKMSDLLSRGTIDEELFNMWLDKCLSRLNDENNLYSHAEKSAFAPPSVNNGPRFEELASDDDLPF